MPSRCRSTARCENPSAWPFSPPSIATGGSKQPRAISAHGEYTGPRRHPSMHEPDESNSDAEYSAATAKCEVAMTVRAGREFLAVPGPTNIPDEVLQAMHRPAVEIYSEPLIALTDGLLRDLAKVFGTATRPYIYIANGHGAWEAALTNVLSRGDKILVLESGQFAIAWGDAAARLGVDVE